MIEKNLENMSEEEFDDLIEHFISRGQDKIELPTFLQVMADLADKKKQREIELSGQVVDDDIIFDSPTPIPVGKNEIYIGDTKIVLKLRAGTNYRT